VIEDLILIRTLPAPGSEKSVSFGSESQVDGPIRLADGTPEQFLAKKVVDLCKRPFFVSGVADAG
jgi:hypothetical protein